MADAYVGLKITELQSMKDVLLIGRREILQVIWATLEKQNKLLTKKY